jgi:hypothetical protein
MTQMDDRTLDNLVEALIAVISVLSVPSVVNRLYPHS